MSAKPETICARIETVSLFKEIASGFKMISDCAIVTFSKKHVTIRAVAEGNICNGILEVNVGAMAKYRYRSKTPEYVMVIDLASLVNATKSYQSHIQFDWSSADPDQVIFSCVEESGYVTKRNNKLNLEELMVTQPVPQKQYGLAKRILSAAFSDVCKALFASQVGSAVNVPFTIAHSREKSSFLFTIFTNGDRNGTRSECGCDEYVPDEPDDDSDDGDYLEEVESVEDTVSILNPELGKVKILKKLCSTTEYFRIHYASRMEMAKIVFDLHDQAGTCTIILPTMTIR